MSIFTVVNTNDSGAGSLRQCILDANSATVFPIVINFNISGSPPFVIQPLTALPAITNNYVSVDAASQPGYSTDAPVVMLDGLLITANGLVLLGTSNSSILGFAIGNFVQGIAITDDSTNSKI